MRFALRVMHDRRFLTACQSSSEAIRNGSLGMRRRESRSLRKVCRPQTRCPMQSSLLRMRIPRSHYE